jgi:hypothetical protein
MTPRARAPADARRRVGARREGVYERTLLWPPAFLGQECVGAVLDAFRSSL